MRGIEIDFCNIVTLRWPVYFIVVLGIKFLYCNESLHLDSIDWDYLSKSKNEVILFGFESYAIQVTHGNIYCPSVYPPSMWVDGKPVREKPVINLSDYYIEIDRVYIPKLWRHRIIAFPLVNVQNGQPKFTPRWNTSCTPYIQT